MSPQGKDDEGAIRARGPAIPVAESGDVDNEPRKVIKRMLDDPKRMLRGME